MFHTVDSGVIFDYIKPEQSNSFNKNISRMYSKHGIESPKINAKMKDYAQVQSTRRTIITTAQKPFLCQLLEI